MSQLDRNSPTGTQVEPGTALATSASIARLLVPLDGSHLAEAALPVVTKIGDACHSTIVLLHVLEKDAPARIHGDRHLTNSKEAEAYLAQLSRQIASEGRQVECHVHEVPVGDVTGGIAVHADELKASLIVLSTHGEGGIKQAIWGSIAQQVLQRSTRPVLLVHSRMDNLGTTFTPRSIMVPLDATAAGEAALPLASALARCLGTQLRLIIVVPTSDTVTGEQQATATFLPLTTRALLDAQEEAAAAYLDRLAAAVRTAGIPAIAEVRRGDTVTQLATDTGEHADGLVVVATHGRAGLQAIWSSSIAARLLKRTPAPILLVPIVESD